MGAGTRTMRGFAPAPHQGYALNPLLDCALRSPNIFWNIFYTNKGFETLRAKALQPNKEPKTPRTHKSAARRVSPAPFRVAGTCLHFRSFAPQLSALVGASPLPPCARKPRVVATENRLLAAVARSGEPDTTPSEEISPVRCDTFCFSLQQVKYTGNLCWEGRAKPRLATEIPSEAKE